MASKYGAWSDALMARPDARAAMLEVAQRFNTDDWSVIALEVGNGWAANELMELFGRTMEEAGYSNTSGENRAAFARAYAAGRVAGSEASTRGMLPIVVGAAVVWWLLKRKRR